MDDHASVPDTLHYHLIWIVKQSRRWIWLVKAVRMSSAGIKREKDKRIPPPRLMASKNSAPPPLSPAHFRIHTTPAARRFNALVSALTFQSNVVRQLAAKTDELRPPVRVSVALSVCRFTVREGGQVLAVAQLPVTSYQLDGTRNPTVCY